MTSEPLLSLEVLSVGFNTDEGRVRVVEYRSFQLSRGGIVVVVGDSACGKSVPARAVIRLPALHHAQL